MKVNKICIVGGGTAGWMTAATFSHLNPDKELTLIESPNVPTIGVGESTTQFISDWLRLLDIKPDDWMEECDATYKYSVRFENFSATEGAFHYPFIDIIETESLAISNWFVNKTLTDCPVDTFAKFYCPQYKSIVENRIIQQDVDFYNHKVHRGYHIDAAKFANWLRINKCQKVNHIIKHVDKSILNEDYDLFVDCTGFKSLLSDVYDYENWDKFDKELPNDRAWTVRLPYTNKCEQQRVYTNCTGMDNGWVWNVPLRSRIGTGYNFSSKFVSDEDALEEFKKHLGYPKETLSDYRLIKFRTGLSDKPWRGKVLSIGLSGGFIEPLESNSLLSVHDWLIEASKVLTQPVIRKADINFFNTYVREKFINFKNFVAMHYHLSTREDTPYWKYLTQEYESDPYSKLPLEHWTMGNLYGAAFICAGHNYNPFDRVMLELLEKDGKFNRQGYFSVANFDHYDKLQESFPFAVDYYERN